MDKTTGKSPTRTWNAETTDRNQPRSQQNHESSELHFHELCAWCTDPALLIYIVYHKYKQPEPPICLHPHGISIVPLEEKTHIQNMDFLGLLKLLSLSPAALHKFKETRLTKENKIQK